MAATTLKRVGGFQLLSQSARDRLRARVMESNGDIDSVKAEVQAKLDVHDDVVADQENGGAHLTQAERAFYIAQLDYLEALRQAQQTEDEPEKSGFFARFKGAWGGSRAAQ